MEPNYNFERELSSHYGIAAANYRSIANQLLVKWLVITQKEYDIVMWQACNLPSGSLIRIELLNNLIKIKKDCELNDMRTLQLILPI